MTIQITPELANAWQLRVTAKKIAKSSTRTKQTLIESFNLGKTFSSRYLAVGIIVPTSKDSWQFGGRISQEFSFFNTAQGYVETKRAFNLSQELLINRVTFVQFPPISAQEYKINYLPPRYFSEVTIQVWEYVGETIDERIEKLIAALEANTLPVDFSDLLPILEQLKEDLANNSSNNSEPKIIVPSGAIDTVDCCIEEDDYLPGYY